ncbi:Zinc knuckle CX2CX4HX4C [Trema orientale]|uniref:Zinc knuckle CX2CX4HX4C n=1 Tax=Trema orientale TaxID=63057 RepID=A0A2P5FQL5_TREOI|nr:Zinc knuckle CX2CX4HX4C [Trema orientale]
MGTPLDRYTTAFLLSGYGFNDYKLKPHQNAEYNALNQNLQSAAPGSSFLGNIQDSRRQLDEDSVARSIQDHAGLFVNQESIRLVGLDSVALRDVSNTQVDAQMAKVSHGPDSLISAAGSDADRLRADHGSGSGVAASDHGSPLARTGAHGLVHELPMPSLGAHGIVREVSSVSNRDGSGAHGLVCAGPSSRSHVSFRSPHVSDLGLSFQKSKNKGVADSLPSSKWDNLGDGPSFAQVLNAQVESSIRPPDSHVTLIAPELSKPTLKGNYVCVKVNKQALKTRLDLCQYSLIGRIFLSKEDSPWKLADLKFKLQSIWKLSSDWRLISLGKDFFHILLSSEEEKNRVWTMGSLHLKPARGVGVPIRFDEMTLKGKFGHFARILIDIDLSQPILDSLMVEVGSDCFFVPLEYERLSDFCSSCKTIGHAASACKRGNSLASTKDLEPKVERGRSRSHKRIYRPVTKSPKVADIPVQSAFATLRRDLVVEGHIEGGETQDTKKNWADDVDTSFDNIPIETTKLDTNLVNSPIKAITNTLNKEIQDPSPNLPPEKVAPALEQYDSSSIEGANSDSLNINDLSPTKIFASVGEGWQEAQSHKKKKALQP